MGVSLKDLPKHVQDQVRQQDETNLSPKKNSDTVIARAAKTESRKQNKWEAAYEQHLALQMKAGNVRSFTFEGVKLRLAEKKTWYTPDFLVVNREGEIEIHEVKGFWRDDARVKLKSAAYLFPFFRFVAITKHNGVWKYEHIN